MQIADLVDPHSSYTRHHATSTNSSATSDASVDARAGIAMSTCRAGGCLEQTHDDDDRFTPPSSAQVDVPSRRATNPHPSLSLTAAVPPKRPFFDPWNSSSTGHQRAENRLSGSTSWRASRSLKLGEQYKGSLIGGKRVSCTTRAGSEAVGKDSRKVNGGWEEDVKGLRAGGQQSLVEIWGASKAGRNLASEKGTLQTEHSLGSDHVKVKSDFGNDNSEPTPLAQQKQIFDGLCFYVNGSTAPLVSDHKLKHLLAAHGARHSIILGRRTVTHVILGAVNANGGAGGGLAANKTQKEIIRTGGKTIKYITAEWVLESIKAGRRLPESRFAPLRLTPKNQGSVFGI